MRVSNRISGSLYRRLPARKQEGLFGVDQDVYAVTKLYIFHDALEGVQFRDQSEIEAAEKMSIVVRDLADVFYEPFADDLEQGAHESLEPGLTVPEDWDEGAEHKTLDEF